ncbi:MAG TPA: peptidylprolyl isomerase [Pyrinomonadaceae bacterium]|jgi:peptidyl-prolyl cis-trans isomerase B (cyclophilin B)|nr:peptidylprolyl isomerase [Pyrinomonadaceae bacterium]
MRLFFLALCFVCFGVGAARAQESPVQELKPEKEQSPPETVQPKRPERAADAAKKNARPAREANAKPEPFDKSTPEQMSKQCVTLVTEEGSIEIEMLAEAAPESVRNFLNLSAAGAYDTTVFSRVVKGFIIQGGDLTTREKVTPELARRAARRVPDEPSEVKHVRGVVSMARADEPDSATTHFFILAGDGPHLDGTFAAFGRVRSGMDVVDKINNGELDGEKPKKPVRLTRATVAPCPAPMSD